MIIDLTCTDKGTTVQVNYWLIDALGEAEVCAQIDRESLLEHIAEYGVLLTYSKYIDDLYDYNEYLTDNLHSVCEGYLKEGLR
jgi:hypothetical protein